MQLLLNILCHQLFALNPFMFVDESLVHDSNTLALTVHILPKVMSELHVPSIVHQDYVTLGPNLVSLVREPRTSACNSAMGERGAVLYLSNFSDTTTEPEIVEELSQYGCVYGARIMRPKSKSAPAFAFVTTKDPLDAASIIRQTRNGWKVMLSESHRLCEKPVVPPPHGGKTRVVVTDLPNNASWQDVKDHVRVAFKQTSIYVQVGPCSAMALCPNVSTFT